MTVPRARLWLRVHVLGIVLQVLVLAMIVWLTGAWNRPSIALLLVAAFIGGAIFWYMFRRLSIAFETAIWPTQVRGADDRGVLVPVATVSLDAIELTEAEAMIIALCLHRQRRAIVRPAILRLSAVLIGAGVCILLVNALQPSFGELEVMVIVFCFAAAVIYAAGRWQRVRNRRRDLSLLRAIGRCGSCGYDLKASTPQPDGCAVCAECGSAWTWKNQGMLMRELAASSPAISAE